MAIKVTREELFRALDDGICVVQEFDDSDESFTQKLAAIGIDKDDLRELLAERWGQMEHYSKFQILVAAFSEGLLTGRNLPR